MTTLHIDMPAGVAGDMLLGALIACGGDLQRMLADLAALGLGPIAVRAETVNVGSLQAVRVDVEVDQDARWQVGEIATTALPTLDLRTASTVVEAQAHVHRPYAAIRDLLAGAALRERVRERAQRVFRVLAEAEGAVHGVSAESVEFHEVGARDAIVDVVGFCLLLEQLDVTRITASAFTLGRGTVRCAHGLMPVPVPAVAQLLASHRAPWRDLGWDTGELTTPTGCALVCALADRFVTATPSGERSAAQVLLASGHGAGHRSIPGLVNAVRCLLSSNVETPAESVDTEGIDTVVELVCHLDDCTGEQLAAVMSGVLAAGALDVAALPLLMKKGRPGHQLLVLTKPETRAPLTRWLLDNSTSIGVRWRLLDRSVLPRHAATVQLDGHVIALKVVTQPDGSRRAKPEADDVARVAAATGRPFASVQVAALALWTSANVSR